MIRYGCRLFYGIWTLNCLNKYVWTKYWGKIRLRKLKKYGLFSLRHLKRHGSHECLVSCIIFYCFKFCFHLSSQWLTSNFLLLSHFVQNMWNSIRMGQITRKIPNGKVQMGYICVQLVNVLQIDKVDTS